MSALPVSPSTTATPTPDATAGAHDPRPAADAQSATADLANAPDTSTADSAANAANSSGSSHPAALRERAVALYCQGHRSPAIAAQLGVSERTVRAWLADARRAFLAHDDTDTDTDDAAGANSDAENTDPAARAAHAARAARTSRERLALAVERRLAIAAAAWQSYHHAFMLEQLALDHHRLCMERYRDHPGQPGDPMPPAPPHPSTACARFLSVALAAQREAARLQGCYDWPKPAPVTTIVNYPPPRLSVPPVPSASPAARPFMPARSSVGPALSLMQKAPGTPAARPSAAPAAPNSWDSRDSLAPDSSLPALTPDILAELAELAGLDPDDEAVLETVRRVVERNLTQTQTQAQHPHQRPASSSSQPQPQDPAKTATP